MSVTSNANREGLLLEQAAHGRFVRNFLAARHGRTITPKQPPPSSQDTLAPPYPAQDPLCTDGDEFLSLTPREEPGACARVTV